ncbi:MAG: rhomboid family intramembrane serine protease [Gemmataceae bacterium]|nr:rhomboid family intramembrane serine protease [Gemmataceae bacterium]
MGIYDRDYYRKDGSSFFETIIPDGRVCRWLIGVNIVVFLLQLAFHPTVVHWLRLDTTAVSQGQVWRLLTYAFVHDQGDVFHIVFNMLFLWWFGTDVEMIYGPREFLTYYLVSAFLGGAAFQAWAMAQGTQMLCIGASGAVTAVLLLCACHYPHRIILVMLVIPVPIWLFAVFQVGQDVYRVVGRADSPVASVVHLAGAAFGLLYYKQQWRLSTWWPNWRAWRGARQPRASALRVYRPEPEKEAVSVAAASNVSEMNEHLEAKLDAVLEKVGRQGEASLTESERMILLRASEIYRRKRT